ncbi:MAG: helix-turn-helix domain-containing protein [Candidatus Dormibacteria bacterium]
MGVDQRSSSEPLREARLRSGLSQAELARRAGVAQSVISVYESGRRQPALATLSSLKRATGHNLIVDLHPTVGVDRMTGPLGKRVVEMRSNLKATATSHGASGLGIFGSVARGQEHPDSDVDLLVDLPERMGLFGLGRLRSDLEAVLGVPIDLVPVTDLRPSLRAAVEGELIPL